MVGCQVRDFPVTGTAQSIIIGSGRDQWTPSAEVARYMPLRTNSFDSTNSFQTSRFITITYSFSAGE
jgi:hypothetical protein